MIQVEFIYYSTKVGFAAIQAMIEFMKSSILIIDKYYDTKCFRNRQLHWIGAIIRPLKFEIMDEIITDITPISKTWLQI